MSDTDVDDLLTHFGVKGMHWGVRKDRTISGRSEDSARAHELRTRVKKSGGIHVLTNDELKDLTTRLNLEQQYSKLTTDTVSAGKKFTNDILSNVAKQQAQNFANAYAKQGIEKLLERSKK
jgi:hypothetical protein